MNGNISPNISRVPVTESFMDQLEFLTKQKGFGYNELSIHAKILYQTINNNIISKKIIKTQTSN